MFWLSHRHTEVRACPHSRTLTRSRSKDFPISELQLYLLQKGVAKKLVGFVTCPTSSKCFSLGARGTELKFAQFTRGRLLLPGAGPQGTSGFAGSFPEPAWCSPSRRLPQRVHRSSSQCHHHLHCGHCQSCGMPSYSSISRPLTRRKPWLVAITSEAPSNRFHDQK
jgi:hypothetical protein